MECSWGQKVHCSCCCDGDAHSTDYIRLFSRLLYDFFLTLTSQALRLFYLFENDAKPSRSHPTSTPLHDTFYVIISMTFDWNANWPFLLQVMLLGMGLQKLISKWIPNSLPLRLLYLLDNDETRVILTQPLHHRIPVLRNVSHDVQPNS
jgi:hypothetical protein